MMSLSYKYPFYANAASVGVLLCVTILFSIRPSLGQSQILPQQPTPETAMQNWHHQGVFLSPSRLALLKQRVNENQEPTYSAFLKLQTSAEARLNATPAAPSHWYVPPFYTDAEGHRKAKDGLANDANSAYEQALMYRLTGQEKYARSASAFIDAWTNSVQTLSTKDDSTLSFSYHFPALIFAADLLAGYPLWPQERQHAFQEFVRNKALPMNTMSRGNNWGNWGLVLVLAAASYLDDEPLFKQGIARWKEFIETQIADDGHLPHEVTRNKGVGEHGLWYSHFCLMPQTLAAEIAFVNGIDLYDYRSPSGHTLRQAFDRLVPWTQDPKTFSYYKGADPKGQMGTNYISYWEILNSHWPNPGAEAMLTTMRPLTATHTAPDLTFTHGGLTATP